MVEVQVSFDLGLWIWDCGFGIVDSMFVDCEKRALFIFRVYHFRR